MKENKIKVLETKKVYEMLGCKKGMFYHKYYQELKEHSFIKPGFKNRRLYKLDKVLELKARLDSLITYEIVE